MKYFIDTEFIEGVQSSWFDNTKPTIDLISIGITSDDDRDYYAISNQFNLTEAWSRFDIVNNEMVFWIRDNVLKPMFFDKSCDEFTYKNFKKFITIHGKSNKQIAEEIKEFCLDNTRIYKYLDDKYIGGVDPYKGNPKFYGWYSDYDWVVFCWLFGKMKDLPKEFPHYCYDIQQLFDDKKSKIKGIIKDREGYPVNMNSHNALSDAIFHKKLYHFLNTL